MAVLALWKMARVELQLLQHSKLEWTKEMPLLRSEEIVSPSAGESAELVEPAQIGRTDRVQQVYQVTILVIKRRETDVTIQKSKKKEVNNTATGDRMRDFRSGQRSHRKIQKTKKCQLHGRHTPGSTSRSDSERLAKVAYRKHGIYTHFTKRPKLRSTQANEDYEGSLMEAHWRSSTSGRKIW